MEINRKLEHLTEEQIEEVITMYKDKSIRLSNIISKYNIDVKPSGLLSILPPIKQMRYVQSVELIYIRS